MGGLGDTIGGALGIFGDDDAGKSAEKAAGIQAGYQQQALEYLKEREQLPQEFREAALGQLAGLYGIEGGVGDQQAMIERAIASPLYQQMIGGREAGEEAILRSAAATGGLRSGNVQEALYDYNTQLQNQALLQSYGQQMQGLTGLANLPSYAPQIAQQTAGIGATLGQGQIAAAQAQQQAQQQTMGNVMGLAQLGMMFSDRRLKDNVKQIGEVNGWKWYQWNWNDVAQKMGLSGESQGVMAEEVYEKNPDAVSIKDCFMIVDYSSLGLA